MTTTSSHRRFIAGVTPPDQTAQTAWWFAFMGNKLLVHWDGAGHTLPTDLPDTIQPVRTQFLGTLDDRLCYAAELPLETIVPEGLVLRGLRELYETIDDDLYALSGRAIQIMDWDRTHQFCGRCATPTVQLAHERAKRCPNCALVNYPRLSPAIIVLVSRGDELLLARAHRFPTEMYSVLAGFVEPGESLEETVIREVREEVGVEVKDIRYFGSQPWPFPNSLMIGFTATYASGDIAIEPAEIADAAWFRKDQLPTIPPRLSIARKLIDWFVAVRPTDGGL